jgi:predicted aspartyl protease
MLPLEFLVDTGADHSTVSKSALSRFGYDIDWLRKNTVMLKDEDRPQTAIGEKVDAGYVQLPLINILSYEGKNWAFQIAIDESQDFVNLLGRDLLTGFNYTFDNDEDEFTIARAKAFKPRSEFLPGQEINLMVQEG